MNFTVRYRKYAQQKFTERSINNIKLFIVLFFSTFCSSLLNYLTSYGRIENGT